jgi:acyl-CoA synthetase (AMP-forming)/AMP-acid ligase II
MAEATGIWSYRQLADAVGQTRKWLIDLGVRPGDRVMIVCENCRVFVAILLATASLDAWPVLVNARLAADEVDAIQDHCRPRRTLYTAGVSPHARDHAKRHRASVQDIEGLGPVGTGTLNENVEPEPLETDVANRVAALIYTSGTTGLPKGVMLTHRNLLFVAAISAKIRSLTPEDRLYGVLPMSHAVGLSVVLLGTLFSGATLYLSSRFDPVAALKSLERDELTVMLGAPAMFSLLLDYSKLKGLTSFNFPKLRIISSSGAPLHAPVKAAVEGLFGMVLHNGYGITECSPNIAQTRIETPRADVSVGQVFPGVEVRIVAPDGSPVPEGEVGELHVRGPNIMKGYYRAPEETAAAVDNDGWFNARDLARMEDAHLFIVGRTKDLIVHFGLNVYPAEVEAVLNAHPGVTRSAVIGRAVEGAAGDEQVIAFVQTSPESSVTESEIAEHAARHLAAYKRPSHIIMVSAMPLTPTGKVVKGELAKMMPAVQAQ